MSKNKECGVYRIRNIINNHRYIGSSCDISRRRGEHFRNLGNGTHPSRYLQAAYNKYGAENFVFEILLFCDNKDESLEYEQVLLNTSPEYNLSPTANSNYGIKMPDTMRANMMGNRNGCGPRGMDRPGWGTVRNSSGRYGACVVIDCKDTHLGTFDTQKEAHDAAVEFRLNGTIPVLPKIHEKPSYGTSKDLNTGRFRTVLWINGKLKHFGFYDTMEEAHDLAIKIKFINWPAHLNTTTA